MRFAIFSLFLLFFNCFSSYSLDEIDQKKIEEYLEFISLETGESPSLDEVELLIIQPINLYNAEIHDLIRIPGFTTRTAKKVLDFVAEYSPHCTYDMIEDSLDLREYEFYLLSMCTQFIPPANDFSIKKKHQLIGRVRYHDHIQNTVGLEKDKFVGDDLDLYQRYNLYFSNFSAGILFDKDYGERSISDFLGGYASGMIADVEFILGDFYIESGMGSILWRPFGARKGAEVINPLEQQGRGAVAYRSSVDNQFFRGLSLKHSFMFANASELYINAWGSITPKSANILGDSVASSIKSDGYFRTYNDLNKKHKLQEMGLGLDLKLVLDHFTIGLVNNYLDYDYQITSSALSAFSGKSGILTSIYASFELDDLMLILAEVSKDANDNLAVRVSSTYDYGIYDFSLGFRSIDTKFRAPYGFSFSESYAIANEIGAFFGFRYKPNPSFISSNYLDIYDNPGPTYYVENPETGFDIFSENSYNINKYHQLRLRYKFERKSDDYKNTETKLNVPFFKTNISQRIEYRWQIEREFDIRARIENVYVNYQNHFADENGWAAFIEFGYSLNDFLSIGARFSPYLTDSYDSAIWQFEYALPGYLTTPALYGHGSRFLIYSTLKAIEDFEIRLRYSQTSRYDVDQPGSGDLEILNTIDNRFICQIDFRF